MSARLIRMTAALAILVTIVAFPQASSAKAPKVVYSVSDGVSSSDEKYVREGIALATSYLKATYHTSLEDDLYVNVRDTADPTNPYTLAFASDNFLVVLTGAPGWDYMAPALRLQTIIHEVVHIVQNDMIGGDLNDSPAWFVEGMAEYVSFDVVQRLGILSLEDIYDEQTWRVSLGLDYMPELYEIEDLVDFQSADGPVYYQSHLAVSALAGDEPVDRLTGYLELIAGGATWQESFEQSFGTTPDDFYEQFQIWLTDEMIAPAYEPDSFRAVSPDGIDADVTVIEAPSSASSKEQIVVIARTDPNAGCRFELRDSNDKSTGRIQSIADATGLVYWLETIPAKTPPGSVTVSVDCGGVRDLIEVPIAA